MEEKDFMDTLWKYFELHANQRMQMMNFYIVIISLFFTALATMFSSENDLRVYESVLCVAIIFFSWIFKMFDIRTRSMIKNCEASIKKIEEKYGDQFGVDIMIFTQEDVRSRFHKEMTYTKILNWEFSVTIIIAFFCLIVILSSWCM